MIKKLNLTLLVLLWTAVPFNALADTPKKITVGLNSKPSFPNRCIAGKESSKYPGVAFDTLRLLEKKINIPIVFVRYPYKRCLHHMEKGAVDAVMTGSYKAKREKFGVYPKKDGKHDPSRRVYNSSYYLYAQKDFQFKWNGKEFSNLKKPIGAELGFSVIDDLRKAKATVTTFSDAFSCFKSLEKGRIAGVAAHESTGQRFVHSHKGIIQIEPPISSKPYYLLLSHQFYQRYPELSEKIWKTIAEMREETKEWQTLKEKYYMLDEWPEGGL